MSELEIDYTVDKLERNFYHGYNHIDINGKHWNALAPEGIVEALDTALALQGINDVSQFLTLLYHITAHQTYHAPVDEDSTLTYHSIAQMLEQGDGNPRINKLEMLLNALGASLAICRIEDREHDIPHEELSRACFYQQLMKKERWPIKDAIALLFQHELQFRIFNLKQVTEHNDLAQCLDITFTASQKSEDVRALVKAVVDISALMRFFNVRVLMRLDIQPAQQA